MSAVALSFQGADTPATNSLSSKEISERLRLIGKDIGYSTAKHPADAAYEELDRQREELDEDNLEVLLQQGAQGRGAEGSRIKELEKSLEAEKRRLAAMEEQLRAAREQQQAELQMVVVKRQSQALTGIVSQLTKQAEQENEQKQKWDKEWKDKIASFHKQHREMEEALKKKHVNEMKKLQKEFQHSIHKLQGELGRTHSSKQQRMPSPRTLTKMQEGNMEKVVQLFHQQAAERLELANKLSKQEELLMRSRSQALNRLMNQNQSKSTQLFQKFTPQISKTLNSRKSSRFAIEPPDLEMEGDLGDRSQASTRLQTSASHSPSMRSMHSRGNNSYHHPLPSPSRLNTASTTFFTELDFGDGEDSPDEDQTLPSSSAHSPIKPRTAGTGHGKNVSFQGLEESSHHDMDAMSNSRSQWPPVVHGADRMEVNTAYGDRSSGPVTPYTPATRSAQTPYAPQQLSYGDQSMHEEHYLHAEPTRMPLYGFSKPSDPQDASLPIPGTEATGWAPFKEPKSKDKKPPWDSSKTKPAFLSQVSAPVYVGERTQKGVKKASLGPYMVPPASVKGVSVPKTAVLGKSKSKTMPAKLPGTGSRSMSTDPRLETTSLGETFAENMQANFGTNMVFPQLDVAAAAKRMPLPQERLDPETNERFAQMESWVDDKIRTILGEGFAPPHDQGTKEHVVSRKPSVTFPDLPLSQRETRAASSGAVQMRDVDEKGIRQVDSRGQTLHTEPLDGTLPSIQKIEEDEAESAEETEAQGAGIGNLLTRLKETMRSDTGDEKRGVLRKSVSRQPNEGMVIVNKDERRQQLESQYSNRVGQHVDQLVEDHEIESVVKEPELDSKEVVQRRAEYDSVVSSPSGKRVRINLDEPKEETFDPTGSPDHDVQTMRIGTASTNFTEATRPNTGDDGYLGDRPETGYTSQNSRPTTGFASSRPVTGSSKLETTDDELGTSDTGGGPETEDEEPSQENLKRELFSNVRHNKVAEVEDQLIQGMPVDCRDEHGNTPLMAACQNNHKRILKVCLRFEGDINSTNHQGNTALHYATAYGYTQIAKYLISKGADDTLMNLKGLSPYDGI